VNRILCINCKERRFINQKCAMCLLKMTSEYFIYKVYMICYRAVTLSEERILQQKKLQNKLFISL